MKRPRRRIDAAPKAKIALEAPHATRFNPNPIYRRKKQLLDNAARAFDPGIGVDADHARERELEQLHAKIGRLTAERDFYERSSVNRHA